MKITQCLWQSQRVLHISINYMVRERRAAARVEGLPTPKKVQMVYAYRKSGQPQMKETGHSHYVGQMYCTNEPGQIPRD